jgi:transmembrane sensor
VSCASASRTIRSWAASSQTAPQTAEQTRHERTLDALFEAASKQAPPARSSAALDQDVARAVIVAAARARRTQALTLTLAVAASLALGALGMASMRALGPTEHAQRAQHGSTHLRLASGDELISEGEAHIDVTESAERRVVTLSQGAMLFDVASLPGRAFVVDAGEVEVRVTGTIFAVTHEAQGVAVQVCEGSVDVESHGVTRALREGDAASFGQPQAALPAELAREGSAESW